MALNKSQLVDAIAKDAEITKALAEKALNATVGAVKAELSNGGNVTLIGFGTFSVAQRAARDGKNPQTGEKIHIPAKKVPKFSAGKALKDMVNPVEKTKSQKRQKIRPKKNEAAL